MGKTLLLRALTLLEHKHARGMRMIGCHTSRNHFRRFRTRQIFPNHRFDVIAFFESVSRNARVFESRANFF